MKKLGDNKVVRFKLQYLREIQRNAMLHATQPKPRTWKSLYDTPVDVMKKMVITLYSALQHVDKSIKRRERIEKKVARLSKGKSEEQVALIRLMVEVEDWNREAKSLEKGRKR